MIERINRAVDGRYRIVRELGEGGMATVYLADDLRHDRPVALKVLKPELAAVVGAERFLAEIKTTANLQHPHILPLHDSGEADGLLFYVMPYVEGDTLRDRIEREKQLPVEEAVALTTKVADALDYAHGRGVVHRDVKPANILLSDRGEPLVADFGIALAVSQAGGGRITETGLSMGTPHYMSPEQATGERDVDPRSDLYALGCVLYEMLAGQPPFTGTSAQAVLARILTEDATDLRTTRRTVPVNVAAAVARALERLPADRFATARDFAEALHDPSFRGTAGLVATGGIEGSPAWKARFQAAAGVGAVLLALSVYLAARPGAEAPGIVRFTERLPFAGEYSMDVSPDGSAIVVEGGQRGNLFFRSLDDPTYRPLAIQGEAPAFWPDGSRITLRVGSGVWGSVPVGGGPLTTIPVDGAQNLRVGDDGYAYVIGDDGTTVGRIAVSGGAPDTLLVDSMMAQGAALRVILPHGHGVLFTRNLGPGRSGLFAVGPDGGEVSALGEVEGWPFFGGYAYDPSGVLLYALERHLMARPFDPESLSFTGEAVAVAEVPEGRMRFRYGGGTLVYSSAGIVTRHPPVLRHRSGRIEELPGLPEAAYDDFDVSPDGSRIAFHLNRGDGDGVWSYLLPDGPLSLVSTGAEAETPRWMPDNQTVLYISEGNAYRRRADGTTPPELVVDVDAAISRVTPTPDGRTLFVQERPGAWDIREIDLDDRSADRLRFADPGHREGHPDVSPDGRWVAYYSDESGRSEIFVQSLGEPPFRQQVSRNGGLMPRWSETGRRLFFNEPGELGTQMLMEARVEVGGDGLTVLGVDSLFPLMDEAYDVLPGDSVFLALIPADGGADAAAVEVTVVLNFDRVLREALGSSRE